LNGTANPTPHSTERADLDADTTWVGDLMTGAIQAQRNNAVRFISRLRKSATRHRSTADAQDRAARDSSARVTSWHSWRAAGQRRAADADDECADHLVRRPR